MTDYEIAEKRIEEARETEAKFLDLGDLRVERLPDSIGSLPLLKVLALGRDALQVSGDAFSWECDQDRPRQQISDLTPLATLRQLTELDLAFCMLISNLKPLETMTQLTRLELSGCEQISDLTPLAKLTRLTSLSLIGCRQILGLKPLATLRQLTYLSLGLCLRISDLTPLATLRRLTYLNLDSCIGVRSFDPIRPLLSHLQKLYLAGCYFHDLPRQICGETDFENVINKVRAYDADRKHGLRADDEVKMFILGNGGVGKTNLRRRLRDRPFEDSPSTLGVEIEDYNVILPNRQGPVRLNLWDFGGQDIYHGTHHLFLHEDAVFILVGTPETESGEYREGKNGEIVIRHRPATYWFDYIRSLAGSTNPVVLVHGKCDENEAEATWPRPIPNDFAASCRLAFSAREDATGEKRQRLQDALLQAASQVLDRRPQAQIPNGWIEVARRLREMRAASRRTLPREEFQKLCQDNGRISDWHTVLTILHRQGTVFWRANLFEGQIILDQSWALEAIYAVFNHARKHTMFREGRFSLGELAGSVWNDKYTPAEQKTFLSMMESCGVCFRAGRLNPHEEPAVWEYIAPELLPEWDAPDITRQLKKITLPNEPPLACAEIGFDFLHEGVLRRLLSWLGSHVGDRGIYWKYGCWFFDPDIDVEMKITSKDAWKDGQPGTITLEGWGAHATRWIDAGIEALETMSPTQKPKIKRPRVEQPTAPRLPAPHSVAAEPKHRPIEEVLGKFSIAEHQAIFMLTYIGDISDRDGTDEVQQKSLISRTGKTSSTISDYLEKLETLFKHYFEAIGHPQSPLWPPRARSTPLVILRRGKIAIEVAREYCQRCKEPPPAGTRRNA